MAFGLAAGNGAALAASDVSPPDLAGHLEMQLSRRTNSHAARFTGPTDGSNWFQRAPVLAPDFWLRDVTNILAMSQGRIERNGIVSCANYLTPISPHICVGAAHTGGGVGTTNVWLLPDGSYYSNIVVACRAPTNASDIMLMFMAKTNWTFVQVFPNATNKLANWKYRNASNTVPVFVRFHGGIGRTNEFHSTFVSGSSALGNFSHIHNQLEFGDYSKGDMWVAGDSGGAAYAIVQNEAVLVGCAFTPNYAVPLAQHQAQVDAAMSALCSSNHVPVESLTIYNLSGFRDY